MRHVLFYSLLALLLSYNRSLAQQGTFVNRNYQENSGNPVIPTLFSPYGLPYSKSIRTSTGYFITAGHSFAGSSEDAYVICRDADGNIIFEQVYDIVGANKNDYALDISEAPNGDFLICGATQTGGSNGFDAFVLRISSAGAYITDNTRDGGNGLDDFAVAIKEVTAGTILVAANRQVMGGMFDYWVMRYDPSLNFQVENFYDFAGLTDITIGFGEDMGASEIQLVGASASGLTACEYAIASFDLYTLAFSGDARSSLSGSIQDKALAFARDASNNTYITGMAWNGTNFEIKTVKINANFTIGWTKTFDPYGFENVGSTIQVDANGNVIVGGYVTKSNNTKQTVCIKYNGSTGNEMWSAPVMQSAENPSGNAVIKKIALSPTGDIYFVGSEKSAAGNDLVMVGKIKSSGAKGWQRNIGDDATINYLPSDIRYEGGNIYVVSIKDSINDEYIITSYTEFEMNKNVSTYGNAKYVKNQLIVRFAPTALDSAAIDNSTGTTIREFGKLKDFMKPTAYATVTAALVDVCREEIKAVKVFPGHTTNFTSTTNRLNQPTYMPDYWTTLLLEFPCDNKVLPANTVFNNLTSIAGYAHPNYLCQLYSPPNDSLYNAQQLSLHSNTVYPGCDINVEEAWTVFPRGGRETVRGGIFDAGVDWEHHEFNYDGVNPTTSKIRDGWSFSVNAPLKSLSHGGVYDVIHGTAIAGIIGAQRNNGRGVAGIAGGNTATGSEGVSLYGLSLWDPSGGAWLLNMVPLQYVANAMIYSCLPPTQSTNNPQLGPNINKYCYELNFQNHSWGLTPPPSDTGYFALHIEDIKLFSEAAHTVNRLNVTSIVARGNDLGTKPSFPANCDDDWVLNITGTGVDGQFAHDSTLFGAPNAEFTSAWGGDIDLGAPCTGSLITSLSTPGATLVGQGSMYNSFGGTSAAAPHVAGAVGLMMSYMNDTIYSKPSNYQNMAPEDCEAILQMSATDTDTSGYDQLTGHGRLNIGKAMRLIEKPYHRLLHFDTDINNNYSYLKQVTSSPQWDTVKLIERFKPYGSNTYSQPGKYIVKKYEINTTVNHNIFVQDTIIASWPRPSSSVTWADITNGKLVPREKTKIISLNNSSASLRGYVYQVKDSLGNSKGWWPVDTSFSSAGSPFGKWSAYSVLTKNYGNPVGIKEANKNVRSISVFPNPTSREQTLLIETDKVCDLVIDVYDIMGRKLKNVYTGKSDSHQTLITHDVGSLVNSMYIYNISIDGTVSTRKFIKQ